MPSISQPTEFYEKNIQHLPPRFIRSIALREILPGCSLSFIYNILYHCSVEIFLEKQEGGREVILLLELQLKKK